MVWNMEKTHKHSKWMTTVWETNLNQKTQNRNWTHTYFTFEGACWVYGTNKNANWEMYTKIILYANIYGVLIFCQAWFYMFCIY